MKQKFPRLFVTLLLAVASGTVIDVFTPHAVAQSASFNTQTYPFLGNNHTTADFNGDAKPDLAGTGANAVAVMLNNGNGTFAPKVDYPLGRQTQAIAAGDFNGDGKMDLVVTLNDPEFSFALLPGTSTGKFNPPVYFPNSSDFDSPAVVAVDLNNDSKFDVVLLHSIGCFTAPCTSARSITILLGSGNGTFQAPQERDVAMFARVMAVGDFNRDGIKDLAIGGENTELRILLGVGNGTFVAQPIMMLVPGGDVFAACNDVDVADFNGDAIQDLVVPLGNGRGNAILLGNGDGTFGQAVRILDSVNFAPLNVAVADYDGDGVRDIARAMGDGTNGLVEILNGNGNGTFGPPVAYIVPPPQSSIGGSFIIASDFNADGRADIALAVVGASPSLRVMINSSASVPPPFLTSAGSRKLHGNIGSFDVPLALTGTLGIEPRSGGATSDYQIVVTFESSVSVTGDPQAQVTTGIAQVGSNGSSNGGAVTVSDNTVIVPLTNVANAQTISVTLNSVSNGFGGTRSIMIPMGVLVADVSGSGSVNATDVAQTKAQIGQVVTGDNFRGDVNTNGTINATDVAIVKSRIGTGMPPQWLPDARLTFDPAFSATTFNNGRCIAVGSTGAGQEVLHLVFFDERDGNREIYYKCSTNGGTSWSPDVRLTNSAAISHFPSIAASGLIVHVVWEEYRDGNAEIYHKRSSDAGVTWEADTRLTNNSAKSLSPSVAVFNDVVHVTWFDQRDGNNELYYKRSTDGGLSWGLDARLTNNPASSIYPAVAVSGTIVHIAWEEHRDGNGEIYYKRSSDGGATWGTDTRLTNNSANSFDPSIAADGSEVNIAWFDQRDGNLEIYDKHSADSGLNWGADKRVTNNAAVSNYPSVSVSGSNVHLVWFDERDGNTEIYYNHSSDRGTTWATDNRLTIDSARSTDPCVAVSGSNVHVVWTDARDNSPTYTGNYEIYHKRNPSGNLLNVLGQNTAISAGSFRF